MQTGFYPSIWLIGGTQESAILAQAIAAQHISCVVTVTTETARTLYPVAPSLQIRVGAFSAESLSDFLRHSGIIAIVDASHPFAVAISQQAIAAATQLNLPYLRYERLTIPQAHPAEPSPQNSAHCLILDSFQTLIAGDYLQNQRVLFTVGYRPLTLFQPWQTQAILFARILPSVTALEAALQAGFTPDRIMALRPPISADLEHALWKQWQLSMVVTKASGVAGGEDIKRRVAADLGIQLVVIARPEINYPQQTSDPTIIVEFCQQQIAKHA